jgi:kynurenine formamidase
MVYSVDEACDLLAKRTGWHKKYSREEVYRLIRQYLPGLSKAGKRYFLTEVDLNTIERGLKTEKRPKMY